MSEFVGVSFLQFRILLTVELSRYALCIYFHLYVLRHTQEVRLSTEIIIKLELLPNLKLI